MENDRHESFFARLISPMLDQLRRIAHGTRGEQSVDDLKAEAWIAAQNVRGELGELVEPEDERLQTAVLSKLRKAFGKFVNRKMRFAVQLDHGQTADDGDLLPNSIAARLAAPDTYEPAVALEREEVQEEREGCLLGRFAEAVAYLRSLDHFNGDRVALAAHLAITEGMLSSRLRRAEIMVQRQPSIFDGAEAVPLNFMPLRGRMDCPETLGPIPWTTICTQSGIQQLRLFSKFPALLGRR